MINADMRSYNYYTFGEKDRYGDTVLSDVKGSIKMTINSISQTIVDNPNYEQSTYIGLTRDTKVDSTYVIDYEGTKLKVLYVITKGRLKQVYMSEM